MEQYEKLRREYPHFYYRGYEAEWEEGALNITYTFEIEGLSVFTPHWTFPLPQGRLEEIKGRVTEEMLFSLGMVELISYWKIACPPQVYIEKGKLDSEQIRWWKHLYFNGLGEFFYVNGIEEAREENFMEIHCQDFRTGKEPSSEEASPVSALEQEGKRSLSKGFLVPIGGGKDSAVTLDLLMDGGYPVYGYIINPRGASLNTAERAGLSDEKVMKVKRTLDQRMLELNRRGYLNGHTPFSALVAFSSLIGAAILAALGAVELWFAFSPKSVEEEMGVKVDERALFIATRSGHLTLKIMNGLLFAGAMLALVGYGFTKDALWMAVALTLCAVIIVTFLVLLAVNCYYEKKY